MTILATSARRRGADHEYALVSAPLTWDGASEPRLIVRKLDANNYVEVGPNAGGYILVNEVVNGVTTRIGWTGVAITPGTVTITADLYVDWIAVRLDGTPILGGQPFTFLSAHNFRARTSTGTTGTGWGAITVGPTDRVKLNWPRFHHLGTRVFPDIALGSSGAWDSTDCNNPNVLPNPSGGWILSYTGYYNDGIVPGDEAQEMGIAHAATLDGPWTKDPRNPLFGDPWKWSMNGGLVHVDGTWVQCYGTGTDAMTVGIATSTNLVDWTVKPTIGAGHDTMARVREDGTTIDVYCKRDTRIWVYTSADKGETWTSGTPILSAPAWFSSATPSFAEPCVYVPPGKEGEQMILTVDRTATGGRHTMMGITVDGGASWQWALLHAGSVVGSGDRSRFDSFLAHDGAGGFYLYYCGSDSTTGTLNGALKIGHRRINWNPATLVRT